MSLVLTQDSGAAAAQPFYERLGFVTDGEPAVFGGEGQFKVSRKAHMVQATRRGRRCLLRCGPGSTDDQAFDNQQGDRQRKDKLRWAWSASAEVDGACLGSSGYTSLREILE